MRLVRLVALVGSLMLLVATTVSLFNRRAETRSDQIAQVESSADILVVAVRANVNAVASSAEIAGVAASESAASRPALAAELAEIFPGAEACVGAVVSDCSGANLFSLPLVSDLLGRADEEAVSAVETATGSVMFVQRPEVSGNPISVIVRVPIESLVRRATQELVRDGGAEYSLLATASDGMDARTDAAYVDGQRIVEAGVGDPFVSGSIVVRVAVDGRIGFAGGSAAIYVTLLVLGAVIQILAGVAYLRDRRSLQRQASTDELTGLVNRREFERIAAEALEAADRFGTGLCVMVIDLNGFKQVNDTLGHPFGDLVLKASSERLVAAVRDTDVVGRWGGDEFVIMLPGLEDRTAVRSSAERISETLSRSPVVGDTTMTASIGAAIFPRHGADLDALMRAADVAMYAAKTTGVSHRIADTIAVQEDVLAGGASPGGIVDSDDYRGPDRRQGGLELPATLDDVFRGDDSATEAAGATPVAGGHESADADRAPHAKPVRAPDSSEVSSP